MPKLLFARLRPALSAAFSSAPEPTHLSAHMRRDIGIPGAEDATYRGALRHFGAEALDRVIGSASGDIR